MFARRPASRIDEFVASPGVRRITPVEAHERHLRHKPARVRNVPPVLVNVNQRPSVYVFDKSIYPNEFSNGVLKSYTSNHQPSHAALVRLATAESEIDVVALVNRVYYTARAVISTAAGSGNRYFNIRIVESSV